MSKHKALELAARIGADAFAERIGNNLGRETAAAIHAQHALIVQMREALKVLMVNSSLTAHQIEIISTPLAAADQYLGEKACKEL